MRGCEYSLDDGVVGVRIEYRLNARLSHSGRL